MLNLGHKMPGQKKPKQGSRRMLDEGGEGIEERREDGVGD